MISELTPYRRSKTSPSFSLKITFFHTFLHVSVFTFLKIIFPKFILIRANLLSFYCSAMTLACFCSNPSLAKRVFSRKLVSFFDKLTPSHSLRSLVRHSYAVCGELRSPKPLRGASSPFSLRSKFPSFVSHPFGMWGDSPPPLILRGSPVGTEGSPSGTPSLLVASLHRATLGKVVVRAGFASHVELRSMFACTPHLVPRCGVLRSL